jgi:hypothetical protein
MASLNIKDRLQADPTDPSLAGEVRVFQGDDLEPHFQPKRTSWMSSRRDGVPTTRIWSAPGGNTPS